jgi:hypothetical protein
MIKLISRKEALKNEVFASFIGNWQKRFDPRVDPYMTEPGNYFDWELDKQRWYSQDEIDEINTKVINEFLRLNDKIEVKEIKSFGELKYNLPLNDILLYSIELGKTLEKLSKELNSELIFILDYSVPWLYQKNDYEPVTEALQYLKKMGVCDDFVGGFKCNGDELAEFVSNLFWIIRCNASLPYCWFSTEKHEFVGDLCEHGNIHFHTYSEKIREKIQTFATKNSLVEIDECIEAFFDGGGIQGRQIDLNDFII